MLCAGIFTAGDFMLDERVSAAAVAQENILSVTGVAEVYGDGEKISAAIVEYPRAINPKSVSAADFEVDGKVIEAAFVNDQPEITGRNKAGRYVILKFAYENTAFDGSLENRGRPDKNLGGAKTLRTKDAPMRSDRKLPNLSFSVKQIGALEAKDGTKFLPNNDAVACGGWFAPVINSFQQLTFDDPATGNSMPYNLFLPEGYSAAKKYPLVVFIADASANINEVTTPLFQGNGATSFAAKDFQKKHPCIILAPQYTADLVERLGMMTTDENIWTDGLELTKNLILDVIKNYAVDEGRIYGTGQSQGGMANIAISDRYPELFAAQLLVACQWNVDEMEVLRDKNLWIVVCEGDTKAFPGMNAAVERWEKLGAKVARNENFWDSKAAVSELNRNVKEIERQKANINYTVFAGGNHMYTWSFAYNIGELREWLFKHNLGRN